MGLNLFKKNIFIELAMQLKYNYIMNYALKQNIKLIVAQKIIHSKCVLNQKLDHP